ARTQDELQQVRHALCVSVPKPRKAEEGLDHVDEALAGCDFDPHAGLAPPSVPPVVPGAGLDDGGLALTKNAGLPVALHSQCSLEDGEFLLHRWMVMFTNDARPH